MASAFGKLVAAEETGRAKSSKMQRLCSSHPDMQKRMKTVEEKAVEEGFKQA